MIKKWLKHLIDFLFGEHLKELQDINSNLAAIRGLLRPSTKPQMESEKLAGFTNLQPLQPLSKGGSIYPAEE